MSLHSAVCLWTMSGWWAAASVDVPVAVHRCIAMDVCKRLFILQWEHLILPLDNGRAALCMHACVLTPSLEQRCAVVHVFTLRTCWDVFLHSLSQHVLHVNDCRGEITWSYPCLPCPIPSAITHTHALPVIRDGRIPFHVISVVVLNTWKGTLANQPTWL